jgi:hypothetical protein
MEGRKRHWKNESVNLSAKPGHFSVRFSGTVVAH